MKARVILLAVSVTLGMAVAQTNPPDPQQPPAKPEVTPTQSQTTPQKAAPGAATSQATYPEMNSKTYKGALIDMSCASRAAVSSTSTTQPASAPDANSANRASSDSSNCAVSTGSTELGMKLKDGRTVRFDLVGNQRAQEALKNDKHWNKDLTAGKTIQATVEGVLNGDKLIVSSIH